MEDETTEVAVGCNDVVGLFFLAKLVTVVLGFSFGGFTHQGAGHQGAVHGGEQAAAENTGHGRREKSRPRAEGSPDRSGWIGSRLALFRSGRQIPLPSPPLLP